MPEIGAQEIVDCVPSIQQLNPGLGHGCLDARPARQGAEIGGTHPFAVMGGARVGGLGFRV